jgi:hypothetical protein
MNLKNLHEHRRQQHQAAIEAAVAAATIEGYVVTVWQATPVLNGNIPAMGKYDTLVAVRRGRPMYKLEDSLIQAAAERALKGTAP